MTNVDLIMKEKTKRMRLCMFITLLVGKFGYQIEHFSYRELAQQLGGFNHCSVRNYMIELQSIGVVVIERVGKNRLSFIINQTECAKLMNYANI